MSYSRWRFPFYLAPYLHILPEIFFMMLYVFHAWAVEKAALFQRGWLVESLLTQILMGIGVLIPNTPVPPLYWLLLVLTLLAYMC